MEYPDYLTKCIGEELRFIFSISMEVNLEKQLATCTGSMSHDGQDNYDRTQIKLVFGNRMKDGFYISSHLEENKSGTPDVKLDLKPLEHFDDKFSKSKLISSEILKSIKLVNKGNNSALCLTFISGNSMLFSAVENDQSESSIVVKFESDSVEEVLQGYDVKEEY